MTIVTRLRRSVQRLGRRARLTADEALLLEDVVCGISEKKSCHLSEIARACRERVPLRTTERRLSEGLAEPSETLDALPRAWRAQVGGVAKRLPYVAVDLSEISKPYGRAFEHLGWIRDASLPGRPTTPGYWLITISAVDEHHTTLPLTLAAFSTDAPEYRGWFETIHRAIAEVCPFVDPSAIWLFDRGFDGQDTFRVLDGFRLRWVVRLRAQRTVEFGDVRTPSRKNVRVFANGLRTSHAVGIRYVDKSTHAWATIDLSFGYAPVRVEGVSYTLLVVRGTRGEDWLLFTSETVRDAKHAARLVRAYVARWSAEEWIRCVKQSTRLEDLRVRGWASIRRMVFLAMLALGIQALWLLTRPTSVAALLQRVKSFFVQVPFLHYRLWEGTADALAHGS